VKGVKAVDVLVPMYGFDERAHWLAQQTGGELLDQQYELGMRLLTDRMRLDQKRWWKFWLWSVQEPSTVWAPDSWGVLGAYLASMAAELGSEDRYWDVLDLFVRWKGHDRAYWAGVLTWESVAMMGVLPPFLQDREQLRENRETLSTKSSTGGAGARAPASG
jgi:hypothetical protein